ncbi:MAG: hypothetical protein AAGH64_12290 [Planctomycetota bacterium]
MNMLTPVPAYAEGKGSVGGRFERSTLTALTGGRKPRSGLRSFTVA